MAVLKLYGAPHTTSTYRVGTVLHAAKVPFELIEVDIRNGEHKTAAYREKLPFGLTPYIDDDGFILYETRAITSQSSTLHALIDKEIAALDKMLDAYKVILVRQKYLAGDLNQLLTSADLFHLPYAPLLATAGSDVMIRKPNVARFVLWSSLSELRLRRMFVVGWYNKSTSMSCWLAFEDGVKTTLQYELHRFKHVDVPLDDCNILILTLSPDSPKFVLRLPQKQLGVELVEDFLRLCANY
ncbi:hypothetical protein C8F04DRAFT_1264600 [Mycena alexandri]|uniref:glutathione transferase n=1 Tax=Mycena alexandri TaxID=1745969 RepID=A0AAD6SL86_9AGAR|nr:hypothetical protein C8F04DRAFT_1264600 [Mycena alexandri]